MSLLLENRVLKELQRHLPPSATLLLACSGGMDSMCLAHLLYALDQPLAIAHVNYGLRGPDSDQDAILVKEWAAKRKLPFYLKTVPPAVLCAPGESIQMAARRWRYAWLEEIRASLPQAVIVTAHHLDDSIETFLQNTLRGTGVKGLNGITNRLPTLIRPLQQIPRSFLLEYATENQVIWREDVSNGTAKYNRNYLRLEVLPVVEKRFPNYREGFRKTMAHVEATSHLQQWAVQYWKDQAWTSHDQGASIQPDVFCRLPFAPLLVVEWLQPLGFHPDQCAQILEAGSDTSFFAEDWILYKGKTTWELRKATHWEQEAMTIPLQEGKFSTPEGPVLEITFLSDRSMANLKGQNYCVIDAGWLQGSSFLTLRHWKEGDRIQPLGMQGKHQKIQDVLTNAKVPAYEKKRRVLEVNGHIIWVPGLKRSMHGLIHDAVLQAVLLTWHPSQQS